MKLIALVFTMAFAAVAIPQQTCHISEGDLMGYEEAILAAHKLNDQKFEQKIHHPLQCILQIHEKGEGFLKYLANSFLRPLMGGLQSEGVPKDMRYQAVAAKILGWQSKQTNLILNSVMTEHARGAWGFYEGFCNPKNQDSCIDFLPSENQIDVQSPLIAASSMLLLRTAYFGLSGKPRDEVAARIRKVYESTKLSGLPKKMIEQIYNELFGTPLDLSSLT